MIKYYYDALLGQFRKWDTFEFVFMSIVSSIFFCLFILFAMILGLWVLVFFIFPLCFLFLRYLARKEFQ